MKKVIFHPNEYAKKEAEQTKRVIENLQQLIDGEKKNIAPEIEKIEAIKEITSRRIEANEIKYWDKIYSHKKSDKLIKAFYDEFTKKRIILFEQYRDIQLRMGTITMDLRRYEKQLRAYKKYAKVLENPSKYNSLIHTEKEEIIEGLKRTKWPHKKEKKPHTYEKTNKMRWLYPRFNAKPGTRRRELTYTA